MNAVGLALVWCVLQVTLVGLFAAVLYGAVHRLRPAAAGPVAMAALVVVVGLSVLALSPWPQWRFSSHRGEEAGAAAETTVAAGSDLSAARDALAGNAAAPASQDTAPAAGRFSIAVALVQALVAEMGRLDAAPHEAVWRWPAIVAVVLVSGMGCGLVWLILGAFAVRKERVRSAVVADADLREEIDIVRAELGCVRPIEVHQGNGLSTAATIGWRRPVILLPEDWRSWTAAQRRAVLAHEIAHVRSGHFLALVWAQVGLALHFYHPLVHWLVARLRLEQELEADAAAARLSGGSRAYLATIAELALRAQDRPLAWPARSFLPTRNAFVRRIAMLRDSKLPGEGLSPAGRAFAVGAVVVFGLLVAGMRGRSRSAEAAAEDASAARQTVATAANDAEAIDLTHVPADARALIVVRPGEIVRRREFAALVAQIDASAQPYQRLSAERQLTMAFTGLPMGDGSHADAELVILVQMAEPYDVKKVLATMGEAVKKEYAGKTYYVRTPKTMVGAGPRAIHQADERTFAETLSEDQMQRYLAGPKGPPRLLPANAWKQFGKDHVFVAVDGALLREAMRPVQPEGKRRLAPQEAFTMWFSPVALLWDRAEWLALGARLDDRLRVHGFASTQDKEGAEQIEQTLGALRTLLANLFRQQTQVLAKKWEGSDFLPQARLLADSLLDGLQKATVSRDGNLVRVEGSAAMGPEQIRFLLDSFFAARRAAERAQSINNLKQIGIAIHNYYDAHKEFPRAVCYGPDGKTPYSWRVAILPFLGQKALYDQYRFDEPWDGPNNRKLAQTTVPVYHAGSSPSQGFSSYYVLTGPGTIFEDNKSVRMSDITDGTSSTLLVVEAKRSIPWTKPEDIPYDKDQPLPELGGIFEGIFNVALADVSVRFLPKSLDEKTLRAMITRSGGESVNPDKAIALPK